MQVKPKAFRLVLTKERMKDNSHSWFLKEREGSLILTINRHNRPYVRLYELVCNIIPPQGRVFPII